MARLKPYNLLIIIVLCGMYVINAHATLSVQHQSCVKKHIDIYGHRGFRAIMPENTIPAYRAALALGLDVIDMDVTMQLEGYLHFKVKDRVYQLEALILKALNFYLLTF